MNDDDIMIELKELLSLRAMHIAKSTHTLIGCEKFQQQIIALTLAEIAGAIAEALQHKADFEYIKSRMA